MWTRSGLSEPEAVRSVAKAGISVGRRQALVWTRVRPECGPEAVRSVDKSQALLWNTGRPECGREPGVSVDHSQTSAWTRVSCVALWAPQMKQSQD